MALNGQKIIEAKKLQEEASRDMRAAIEADDKVKRIADFEIQTTKKIETKQAQKRFNELNGQRMSGLMERRRILAEIYNRELNGWREEVLLKVESVEERKARIMERAYKLRDAREASRKGYIEDCYNRQWREACDDARTLDSGAMSMWVGKERKAQIDNNQVLRGEAAEQEAVWVENWKKQLAEIDAKEDGKGDFKKQMEMETQEDIRRQMEKNYALRESLKVAKRNEDIAEIAECRAAIAEEDAKQAARRQRAVDVGIATAAYNAANAGHVGAKTAQEKEHDSILLAYSLRKEAAEKAVEQKKKDDAKAAAQEFRMYLQEQMVKDAEDDGALDAMREAEARKVYKQREDALNAREEARATLMRSVMAGREEQIQAKMDAISKARQEEIDYAKTFIQDAKDGMAREGNEAAIRREANELNQNRLNEQIERRRLLKEREQQEVYLADKQMERMERLHKQKLTSQAGNLRLHFGKKSGNLGF